MITEHGDIESETRKTLVYNFITEHGDIESETRKTLVYNFMKGFRVRLESGFLKGVLLV